MTEAAALELRHVRLAEPVTLRPAPLEGSDEEGVFVALEDSPPVRTVLAVVEGGRRRALEVVWVVEVVEPGGAPTRGFYGRWVADEALERAARVGTEHLEDGTPVVQPVVHDNSAVLDVSDTSMAMPAPVIVLDDDDGERDEERAAEPSDDVAPRLDPEEAPTGSYEQHHYSAETVSYPHHSSDAEPAAPEGVVAGEAAGSNGDSGDAADSGDANGESAEASTDSGDANGESAEASTDSGDASAPAKSGRKKRGRKRR